MVAIYHFRPGLAAVPSQTDLREHAYGDLPRAIVALGEVPTVRLWRLTKRYCEELEWHLQPSEPGSGSVDTPVSPVPPEVGRVVRAGKLPYLLGAVLCRGLWPSRTSRKIPIGRLQDDLALEPEPMWDPSLDNPPS
jgi:hypothetical protein